MLQSDFLAQKRAGSNRLKESVRMIGIKNFICPHHGHKVLCLAQVDDVVRVSRQHVDSLYPVSAHLKLDNLIGSNLPLLNKSMTGNYDEKLPLAVMPVLPLGNARF